MDLDHLAADIAQHISAEQRHLLVQAVTDAYDKAAARHSPADGDDAQLFGFTIYKYVVKRLVSLTKLATTGLELRRPNPMIRLGAGPFTIAAYACGTSGEQLISESFPNNEHGAPQLVDLNQFCLEINGAHAIPRSLVLAHMGNPENGLEAIYLAMPGKKADNRISEWSYTEALWKRADEDPQPADLPRAKPISPAPLTLKFPVDQPQISDRN